MLRHNTLFTLLSILVTTAAQYSPPPSDNSQVLTLYDSPNCTGQSVTLPGYVPNMAKLGWDNRGSSAKLRGMWIGYDMIDYNWATDSVTSYSFRATETCVDFLNPSVDSSAKFVGFPNDYTLDSITFYTFTWFQGAEKMVTEDKPMLDLNLRISSLIYTGTSSWTIYDQPNYMGNSLCLQTPNQYPSIVSDTVLVNPSIPHGSISSVRKGCFSMNTVTLGGNSSVSSANNQGPRNIPFD